MRYETSCLIFNTKSKVWSVENRPPPPPTVDPRFEWSDDTWSGCLEKATDYYRKHGEKTTLVFKTTEAGRE